MLFDSLTYLHTWFMPIRGERLDMSLDLETCRLPFQQIAHTTSDPRVRSFLFFHVIVLSSKTEQPSWFIQPVPDNCKIGGIWPCPVVQIRTSATAPPVAEIIEPRYLPHHRVGTCMQRFAQLGDRYRVFSAIEQLLYPKCRSDVVDSIVGFHP